MKEVNSQEINKLNKINYLLGKKFPISEVMDEIKNENIKGDNFTIGILAINWDHYKDQFKNKEELIQFIKKLISKRAILNNSTKNLINLFIKLTENDIKEIETFKDKYIAFEKSKLTEICINFFKKENINLEEKNIPRELKDLARQKNSN